MGANLVGYLSGIHKALGLTPMSVISGGRRIRSSNSLPHTGFKTLSQKNKDTTVCVSKKIKTNLISL